MTAMTLTLDVAGIGPTDVTITQTGRGRPNLLLHGGGGPRTVAGFAAGLASGSRGQRRVITPVHPGFAGTPRPSGMAEIRDLAALYVALLDELDLHDVTVIGNSIGGWIAAEMALLHSERVAGYVLVDAVGIEVPGHPITDVFALAPAQIADYSYYEPDKFRIDPGALPAEQQHELAANRAALEHYAGRAMADPTLRARLRSIADPTLVVWGEADRIADAGYGRALADAIPGARFELLTRTGHMPQLETPEALIDVVASFSDT